MLPKAIKYMQLICADGHYWCCVFQDEFSSKCPLCEGTPVWRNVVDQTNGICEFMTGCNKVSYPNTDTHCYDCIKRIDGFISIKYDIQGKAIPTDEVS